MISLVGMNFLLLLASSAAFHMMPAITTPRLAAMATPRLLPATVCMNAADSKKAEAERLAVLAERAALEAEKAELEVQQMRIDTGYEPATAAASDPDNDADAEPMALKAPLRWIGGVYPAVALSFPALSTPAQKARQLTGDAGGTAFGVTLDFVVDTAANTNTVSAEVAGPTSQGGLDLTQVGAIPSGVGAGGSFGGGATYSLGTAELADVPKEERVPFISGLTAAALPIAAPAAAGLLGASFLASFPGGVEFVWGAAPNAIAEGTVAAGAGAAPSITFFGDTLGVESTRAGLYAIDVATLAESGLPSVTLYVNGQPVKALLDTGSPITVLNAAAAQLVGLDGGGGGGGGGNPFAALAAGLKSAQAAARGDVLTVGGANGPVQLVRAAEGVVMSVGDGVEGAAFGSDIRPYVGDLPGLAALGGLGADAGPAAVLGTDVLRRRPRMIFTPSKIFV